MCCAGDVTPTCRHFFPHISAGFRAKKKKKKITITALVDKKTMRQQNNFNSTFIFFLLLSFPALLSAVAVLLLLTPPGRSATLTDELQTTAAPALSGSTPTTQPDNSECRVLSQLKDVEPFDRSASSLI